MTLLLKQLAEAVLGSSPVLATVTAMRPARALILAYHNVVPPGSPPIGDVSLHLPLDNFLEQMDWLKQHFDIVPLDAVESATSSGRPRAAVTFDDAYDGAVNLAIPALAEREIPATIFPCSEWHGGESPWWDLFSVGAAGLAPDFRAEALDSFDGDTERVRAEAVARGLAPADLPPTHRIASAADIRRAAALPGITIGVHTRSHPNLTRLSDDRLQAELEVALEATLRRYDNTLRWLAYPYGLADTRVEEVARSAGFVRGLWVDGGPMRRAVPDEFSLPRVNVPRGVSAAGFRLRCVGIR